jgi:hypothetical protein
VTETDLVPQGVEKVTVNVPRVLLFDVMVNEPEPPDAIVRDVGETVRLVGPPDLETVPPKPVRIIVTVPEPPFLRIDKVGGVK